VPEPKFPEPYFPAPETLSEEELEAFLAEWDQVTVDFEAPPFAPPLPMAHVPKGMVFEDRDVLKYDNPEIQQRVVDLYLAAADECAKESSPLHKGEYAGEYLYTLATLAESTFSPRIYDHVLKRPRGLVGGLRCLYLSVVNPQITLDTYMSASVGHRLGKLIHPGYFYCRTDGTALGDIQGAFRILAFMAELSPDTLAANRETVLSFVEKHARHYEKPITASYRPDRPYYRWRQDLRTREAALDVLQVLGEPEDIPLVEAVGLNLPGVEKTDSDQQPAQARGNQVRAKATRVIRAVEQKSNGSSTKP
jgi:hypothetical protein